MWGGIKRPGPEQVKSGPVGEVGLFQDDQEKNKFVRQPSIILIWIMKTKIFQISLRLFKTILFQEGN